MSCAEDEWLLLELLSVAYPRRWLHDEWPPQGESDAPVGLISQLATDELITASEGDQCAWPPPDTKSQSAVCQVVLIRLDVSGDCDAEDMAMVS